MLDDRLESRDLDWARDHLRRCDACRDRVDDFQEMLLRVERLPPVALDGRQLEEAFALALPDSSLAGSEVTHDQPAEPAVDAAPRAAALLPPAAFPPPSTGVTDRLTELEREIFHGTPWEDTGWDLPLRMEPDRSIERAPAAEAPHPAPPQPALPDPPPAGVAEPAPAPLKEVAIDSHQEPPPPAEPPPAPSGMVAVGDPEASRPPRDEAVREARMDRITRLAVGLGAAACVLLAALLYEGTGVLRSSRPTGSTTPIASVTASSQASSKPKPSPSSTPAPTPAPTPVPTPAGLVASVGDGATGESVYRVRPGTAVPGYTRLVFDLDRPGLPTMVITRPDDLHVVVTFKQTAGANLAVGGIRSFHVSRLEPPVQQGDDLVITVELARPVRPVVFTLVNPARLVVDLYTT